MRKQNFPKVRVGLAGTIRHLYKVHRLECHRFQLFDEVVNSGCDIMQSQSLNAAQRIELLAEISDDIDSMLRLMASQGTLN